MKSPKVSILMPVHNGERHLREAIDSMLSQTFRDFEFIIVDDGSTDGSTGLVKSYADPRIRLIQNPVNRGTVHVLNQGLDAARGEYIVRMDCDDISLPQRIAHQVGYMDRHPGIGISGTGMRLIKKGKLRNTRTQPEDDKELKIALLFNTCFFHPTVILRKSAVDGHRYPENLVYTQDYNFWTRMAGVTGFGNLEETLLHFREHEGQISSKKADLQKSNARLIRKSYLAQLFPETGSKDLELHHRLAENRRDIDLDEARAWLEYLVELNRAHRRFPDDVFIREMGRKWWHCCKKQAGEGRKAVRTYRSSFLASAYRPSAGKFMRFCATCFIARPKRA